VDAGLFWRSLAVQGAAVVLLFGILVALPLPHHFFDDYGWLVGPFAWILCSLVTARVLSLPLGYVMFSALAGGVAGAIVLLVASHLAGMVAGVLVFAASCGSYDEPAGETQGSR
jgi:hypothetical protein